MTNKAQGILELAVMIILIAAALVAMQTYFKRGLQGKMRESAEAISGGLLYSPGATYGNALTNRTIDEEAKSYSQDTAESEKSIFESDVHIGQHTGRSERTGSFTDEPER